MNIHRIEFGAYQWEIAEEGYLFGDTVCRASYDYKDREDKYIAWKMLQVSAQRDKFYEVVHYDDGTKVVEMWTQNVKRIMEERKYLDSCFEGYFLCLEKGEELEDWMIGKYHK